MLLDSIPVLIASPGLTSFSLQAAALTYAQSGLASFSFQATALTSAHNLDWLLFLSRPQPRHPLIDGSAEDEVLCWECEGVPRLLFSRGPQARTESKE